jgi:hypothetical protein
MYFTDFQSIFDKFLPLRILQSNVTFMYKFPLLTFASKWDDDRRRTGESTCGESIGKLHLMSPICMNSILLQ